MAVASKKTTASPIKKKTPAVRTATKKKVIKKPTAKKAVAKKPTVKKAATASVVEFTTYPNTNYCEEYQITGFHYAFMSADNKMCHHWVKCRDFLQDALRNQLTGRADAIYGFKYDPSKDPKVETKTTLMLVKRIPTPATDTAKAEFDNMMKSALKLVNHYEKAHKLTPRSSLIRAKNNGNDQYAYLFKGPGIWSQGAVMIAIYTFLIRLGFFQPKFKNEEELMKEYSRIIGDSGRSNDTRYLNTVHKNLHTALENMDKHLFKSKSWKKGDKVLFHDSPMSNFHHHSGIVSLSQFCTPETGLNNEFRKLFKS